MIEVICPCCGSTVLRTVAEVERERLAREAETPRGRLWPSR